MNMKNLNSREIMDEIKQIARGLIQRESYSFTDNQEQEVADYIASIFEKEGIEYELREVLQGRPNITAVIKGTGEGKSLMLSGHLDTVPPYGMKNPFSGDVVDGKLLGRGSCDMKGPLAAMIYAIVSLKRDGIRLKGDLYFTGVIDEEEQGKGTEFLIKNGPYTDGAIIGEPTALRIQAGNRGLEWMEVTIYGKTVHGGSMSKGINAISKAAKLITKLEKDYIPQLDKRSHYKLGKSVLNIGTINGGDQPSTVPGLCKIKIDRRWLPSETREQVYGELRDIINGLSNEDPQFHAELRDIFENDELLIHYPFFTPEDDSLVVAIKDAMDTCKCANGFELNKELTVFPAWSDAGFISNYTSTKCIVLGPGDLTLAHSENEYILTQDLYEAAMLYREIAIEYCGKLD